MAVCVLGAGSRVRLFGRCVCGGMAGSVCGLVGWRGGDGVGVAGGEGGGRGGGAVFFRFHRHDMRRHAWYYRSCLQLLEGELGGTGAWRELAAHIEYVFGGAARETPRREACAG